MIHWWTHASFSHAALALGIPLLIAGFAYLARAALMHREPPARRPWPTVDYSKAYRKHVEWLGDRYLLAKPINRRRA
jgi:hypothetical protein